MKWPWSQPERRAAADERDPVVQALLALQQPSIDGAVGALEASCGLWARAFAAAEVLPMAGATRPLTPAVLAMVGRMLCARGECVFAIDADPETGLALTPAATWNVTGGRRWRYEATFAGPTRTWTRRLGGDAVLHFRYAVTPARPWLGLSPLACSPVTRRLAAAIEDSLQIDFAGVQGTILFAGADAGDGVEGIGTQEELPKGKPDPWEAVKSMRGGLLIADADRRVGSSFGAANSHPASERLGPTPPQQIDQLRTSVEHTVYGACGIPPALLSAASAGAAREAFRQFLHATIAPIGKLVANELKAKLGEQVRLDFGRLFAADLTGRARAFKSLTDSGMDTQRAEALAGLAA